MEIEMLKIIGNSLNLSLDIGSDEEEKYLKAFQLYTSVGIRWGLR